MTAVELHQFFSAYAEAFTRGDAQSICQMWAFPAYFTGRGKRAALDESAFRANTDALLAFYGRRGVHTASKQVLEVHRIAAGTVLVRTEDVLRQDNGTIVAQWEHVYAVTETLQGMRVVMAAADGELDAWQERGTPLGSW